MHSDEVRQYIVVEARHAIRVFGCIDRDFERCLPSIRGKEYIWTTAETAVEAVRQAKIEKLRALIGAACIN